LINAICAACYLLLPDEELRAPSSYAPWLTSNDYYEESLDALRKSEVSSIPSVAGFFIISHIQGHHGKLSQMWKYCGQSTRIALDLSLHISNTHTTPVLLTPEQEEEDEARVHTFWGCFIADQ
jgi:hypothetical protein